MILPFLLSRRAPPDELSELRRLFGRKAGQFRLQGHHGSL
jgi:hypothetical protein